MKPVQIGFTPFPEVNAATFDLYFHDRDRDIDYGPIMWNFQSHILSLEVAQ